MSAILDVTVLAGDGWSGVVKKGQTLRMIDLEGKPFHLPQANQALFHNIKKNLRKDIPVIEMDCDVNNPAFATKCAETLLAHLKNK